MNDTARPDATDRRVAAQYEAYPYPMRDPKDEAKRLIAGSPSNLAEIDYWVFGANRSAAQPLNVLIAGGGTGDATIMLAQQMADAGRAGTITYLDRSSAAREIAQARAAARGLTNIVWEDRSLLDLPGSGLGPFDYIDCCGVLHHLPDPGRGVRALSSVLARQGGMGLMVYAPHGRTGVYMVQDALRLLAPPAEDLSERVATARRVLKQLPPTNWFTQNPFLSDHTRGGDAGLYDLLLHERDRAFTASQLAELLDDNGIEIGCWLDPMRYAPETYLADPKLRTRAAALDPLARAALAEALAGNMGVHVVYCTRKGAAAARRDHTAPDSVPLIRGLSPEQAVQSIQANGSIGVMFDGIRTTLALPRLAAAILKLVDGTRTLGEIRATLLERGIAADAFDRDWPLLWTALNALNRLLLKPPV